MKPFSKRTHQCGKSLSPSLKEPSEEFDDMEVVDESRSTSLVTRLRNSNDNGEKALVMLYTTRRW